MTFSNFKGCLFPTGTPHRIHVDSTWILRRYVEDQISTNFHVISAISMVEKSTWFPRTFFNVISMVEKSALFPCTFFDVISMVEKYTLFPRTFPRTFSVIQMLEISTLFLFTFSGVILMGKDLISFLISYKLMKTFEKVFLVFVTLNSCFQVNVPGVAQFH